MSAERILFLKFVGILKFGILRILKIRKIRILNLWQLQILVRHVTKEAGFV